MKAILFCALILVTLISPLAAQDAKLQQEQQKAMEAYAKAAAVGENHAFLAKFAGDWAVEVTYWLAPGDPPSKSTATFRGELKLGGRYLFMAYNGFMLGQPFEGIQIVGYDNASQRYHTLWIDNTSTSFFLTQGVREGNAILESGSWPDPLTGKEMPVRARTAWISDGEYLYEQFMVLPDGTEHKGMELRCRRQK